MHSTEKIIFFLLLATFLSYLYFLCLTKRIPKLKLPKIKRIENTAKDDSQWRGSFFFVHASDPQFGCSGDNSFQTEINNSVRLINIVNKMRPKPKFLVLTGDFSNEWPNEDQELRKREIDAFKRTYSGLDLEIELILVCGNHDVGMAPNSAVIDDYRSRYGDDYYVYTTGGVMFVVINTSYLYLRTNKAFAEKQRSWLKQVLSQKESSLKHIVVFQHVPWFLTYANEPTSIDNINIEQRLDYLDMFYNSGVRFIFAGHTHSNFDAKYKNMSIIITTSLSCDFHGHPIGYRVVRVHENHIVTKFRKLFDDSEVKL